LDLYAWFFDAYKYVSANIEMKTRYIIIALAFYNLVSCNSNKNNSDGIIQLNYYEEQYVENLDSLFEFITRSDTVNLERVIKNDTLTFTYRLTDESITLSFSKSLNNDSSITIYGLDSKLTGEKIYRIKNHEYHVFKYYYDKPSSVDEESSFFYHQDYGILVGYNDGWMDLIFSMFYDTNSKILIDSIIKDDEFLKSFPIPPPPPPPPILNPTEEVY
jgi:hypothetical protein